MDLKAIIAGRNTGGAAGKTAHNCRAQIMKGRDGEGDMGQTLLTSGPSSGGVEGECKRAFAYEVLLPGNAGNTLAGVFRSNFHPGNRPLGIMTIRGHHWMCLASHRIVIAADAVCARRRLMREAARTVRLDQPRVQTAFHSPARPAPAALAPARVWAKAVLPLPSLVQLRFQ